MRRAYGETGDLRRPPGGARARRRSPARALPAQRPRAGGEPGRGRPSARRRRRASPGACPAARCSTCPITSRCPSTRCPRARRAAARAGPARGRVHRDRARPRHRHQAPRRGRARRWRASGPTIRRLTLVVAGARDPRLPLQAWARDAGLGDALRVTGRLGPGRLRAPPRAPPTSCSPCASPPTARCPGALVRALGVGRPGAGDARARRGRGVPGGRGRARRSRARARRRSWTRSSATCSPRPRCGRAIGGLAARPRPRASRPGRDDGERWPGSCATVEAGAGAGAGRRCEADRTDEGGLLGYFMEEVRWGARDLGLVDVRLGLEGLLEPTGRRRALSTPAALGGHPRLQRGAAACRPTLRRIQRVPGRAAARDRGGGRRLAATTPPPRARAAAGVDGGAQRGQPRQGVRRAPRHAARRAAQRRLMTDADLSTPIEELDRLMAQHGRGLRRGHRLARAARVATSRSASPGTARTWAACSTSACACSPCPGCTTRSAGSSSSRAEAAETGLRRRAAGRLLLRRGGALHRPPPRLPHRRGARHLAQRRGHPRGHLEGRRSPSWTWLASAATTGAGATTRLRRSRGRGVVADRRAACRSSFTQRLDRRDRSSSARRARIAGAASSKDAPSPRPSAS